jgi:hypothetical protein
MLLFSSRGLSLVYSLIRLDVFKMVSPSVSMSNCVPRTGILYFTNCLVFDVILHLNNNFSARRHAALMSLCKAFTRA